MLGKTLKISLMTICSFATCVLAARAETMHFTVPVNTLQTQLVSSATGGAVECFVGQFSIQPLDAAHARALKVNNYGWAQKGITLSGGAYSGTVNIDVDLGSHKVSDARSWYCALTVGGKYVWGYTHDTSAPYSPESFGNIGPLTLPSMELHVIPHR